MEPVCTDSGVFGHPTNCTQNYTCEPAKGHFEIKYFACTKKNQIYDAEEGECRSYKLVNPKPKCWTKMKRVRTMKETYSEVEQFVESEEGEDVKQVHAGVRKFKAFLPSINESRPMA